MALAKGTDAPKTDVRREARRLAALSTRDRELRPTV
jgi:hypothetical protein